MRWYWLWILWGVSLWVGAAERPNFVIILIDDMGYADVGPFGATLQKTPQLDRMAREGMRLTSFYAAPACSVSRAQLLTGCYGARISATYVHFPGDAQGLSLNEPTIAEHLKRLGYATACVGKWHVGDQPAFLPTRRGFDSYFGIPYSNGMSRPWAETGQPVLPLMQDEEVLELLPQDKQHQLVERYTESAVQFIRENQERPFFLYFPHTAVHVPIHPGKRFAGKSANGRFGDWVEEVDWSVGEILDTLRELKLDRKTLVLFTSDNGPWLSEGADAGSAEPLRGGKGGTWEGGMRVPTVAWWPENIAPHTTVDAVSGTIDLLPTLVKLAGGQLAPSPEIDGRDISPLLLGQTQQAPRPVQLYFNANFTLEAVRRGPWKLAVKPQMLGMGGQQNQVPPDARGGALRLYNLDDEIGEITNVAAEHPQVVAELQAIATQMDREIGGSKPRARRPASRVKDAKTLYPMGKKPAPNVVNPVTKPVSKRALAALQPGEALASKDAPQIAQRGFTISCTLTTAEPNTILVAHGGSMVGYALYLKEGKLCFAVRSGASAVAEIATAPLPAGAVQVVARLAADGIMVISINGQEAVRGYAAGLLPLQPKGSFCVGHDDATVITDYGAVRPFQGTISDLNVVTE